MKCAAGGGGDGDRISYIVWCLTPDDKVGRGVFAAGGGWNVPRAEAGMTMIGG